jgi:hypothetical protein
MLLLHQRLERCREVGGLTLANIALWLDEPASTVKGWTIYQHYPQSYKLEYLLKKLADLELAIKEANGPLIPPNIRQRDRARYLRGLLNERRNRVSVADHP